jgi:hypothetical protein
MKPNKLKPLTHAEFSSRGGKAGTPAQNAARAANSLARAAKIQAINLAAYGAPAGTVGVSIPDAEFRPKSK